MVPAILLAQRYGAEKFIRIRGIIVVCGRVKPEAFIVAVLCRFSQASDIIGFGIICPVIGMVIIIRTLVWCILARCGIVMVRKAVLHLLLAFEPRIMRFRSKYAVFFRVVIVSPGFTQR